eukprot:SAG31_NODE_1689_length_7525_cov_3.264745_7_plen_37_part_00
MENDALQVLRRPAVGSKIVKIAEHILKENMVRKIHV